jgi:hypothetical protein
MIVTLTSSNVLTLDEMKTLHRELIERTAHLEPTTARAGLAAIWSDLQYRAGPIIRRHPVPEVLADSLLKSKEQARLKD